MLPQEEMIEKVKTLIHQDKRLIAAMMYGSFTQNEGDAFSDIEFSLYFKDEFLPQVDKLAWVSQVAPVLLFFKNEFGTDTAIFENLIRGEFHFEPASKMAKLREAAWGMTPKMNSQKMLLLDKTLELADHLAFIKNHIPPRNDPMYLQSLAHLFINWMLFGINVLRRGERARALELLSMIHRYLLWMARASENQVDHWPTPSRALEKELSPEACAKFAACTGNLDGLEKAYSAAWAWGKELFTVLNLAVPDMLVERLDEYIAACE